MDWTCLIVDMNEQGSLAQAFHDRLNPAPMALDIVFTNIDEAAVALTAQQVVALVIRADSMSPELQKLLESFRRIVGPFAEFQAVINEMPDPQFMNQVYEYGIERFMAGTEWIAELESFTNEVHQLLSDENSIQAKVWKLNKSILTGDHVKISAAEKEVEEEATYDYLAAYSKAFALQATGRFGEAEEAFRTSNKFNNMFRLAASGLGETLILNGKHDEALAVLQKLEKTNPDHVDRCVNIAVAYLEKGDVEKAKEYADRIIKNAPEHAKVNELTTQIMIREGKVNEAFLMLDKLSDIGPQLAARLNELGIKLSQAGKGKGAIALYNKVHKIVTPELRHKISLNAALACHRSGDFALGLKYIQRCVKEFGGMNPKIVKIKQALEQGMLKAKTIQNAKSAG